MRVNENVSEGCVLANEFINPFRRRETAIRNSNVLEYLLIPVLVNTKNDVSVGSPGCVRECEDMLQELREITGLRAKFPFEIRMRPLPTSLGTRNLDALCNLFAVNFDWIGHGRLTLSALEGTTTMAAKQ
jgi:hypothetical protein